MKMPTNGPFGLGGICAPQGIPPKEHCGPQKLKVGGDLSSNRSQLQILHPNVGLTVPEDGGFKVDNISSNFSIRSYTLKYKISSEFSRLSITPDNWTLVLDEQDESLFPQKKDHQNKSVVFSPSSKSYALTLGKEESPTKDGECEGFDFDIKQDGAILTWAGNSSVHHDHDILQKNEADTPSVFSSFTVDSILEYSNVTDSELSKLGWEEENGFSSIEEEVLEGICGREERRRDLRMPDYDSWHVKALQVHVL